MGISNEVREQLVVRFQVLFPHLNERQRRLVMAQEARLLGHGGVRAVARAAGVSETTVRAGVFELEAGGDPFPAGRSRRPGGGRKPIEQFDGRVLPVLLALVEPDERGDPMSPLRWTTKSLRTLADELTRAGHVVSAPTVRRLLREQGFSLQANVKTLEGTQHPDRDAQFRYINEQVKEHQAAGQPVISVDSKKKEQLGQLPNPGRQWRPKGDPVQVDDHSFYFAGPDVQVAIPYGVYDLTADAGWVSVGTDHDTSAFAVATIRRWWAARGRRDYPDADRLLITADGGGSNSYRYRVWKAELAAFAADAGLAVTVCHFPPGTSKWNKIEHRLFSHITMNWRGRPLTSHEVVVNTIAATRTRTGLRVHAELDDNAYPLGTTISREQLAGLPITPHALHSKWNYTVAPCSPAPIVALPAQARDQARSQALAMLADERLTGLSSAAFADLARRLAPLQDAQAEQRKWRQRRGPRRHARGAHGRPLFTDADRLLVTVIYLRQVCSQKVLADLLGINPDTVGRAISETRLILDDQRITFSQTTLCFARAEDLRSWLATGPAISPAHSHEPLTDPRLTGMSRAEFQTMTGTIAVAYQATVEQRRHGRRGGDRQPGARGGVFSQKITDADRILATVLACRQLSNQQTLADLFNVSRGTIRNAVDDVLPLLTEHGYIIGPAPMRFANANAMIAFATANHHGPPDASETTL